MFIIAVGENYLDMAHNEIKVFDYKDNSISFEFENGIRMINATAMAKIFDKRVSNFTRLQSTKDFIKVLEESLNSHVSLGNNHRALRTVKGGTPELTGTWMEERLALKFAAWLDPHFELWVYDILHRVMKMDTRSLEFHIKKITDSVEEARIWLDTIPYQDPQRNRLALAEKWEHEPEKAKKLDKG